MPFLWLDVLFLCISAIVSFSLALISFSFGPRRSLNIFFSLFTLARAVQASMGIALRLSLWTGHGDALLLTELTIPPYLALCVFLMMFTVRFVERDPKWTDRAAVALALIGTVLLIPLFQHQLIAGTYLEANGNQNAVLTRLGIIVSLLPFIAYTWSLALFWQERRHTGEGYLALSIVIMMAGPLFGTILRVPFPVSSITNTVSVCILGYGVLKHQLFNPLKERTLDLQREVVEREKAEAALRESENRFRGFVEETAEGIMLIDRQGILIAWNSAAERITELAREQALGRAIWDVQFQFVLSGFNDAASFERMKAAYQSVLPIGQSSWQAPPQEVTFQRMDGTLCVVEQRLFPIQTGQGFVLGAVLHDITDRKKVERALEQRAAELRGLFEASLEVNAQPDLTALLQRIVERAALLTGLPQSSLYLLRPDQTLELVVLHHLPAEYLGVHLQPGEGVAGRVVQEGKPLMVEDYQNWADRAAVFDRLPSRRVLSVPLRTRNHKIGALNISAADHAEPFTEDEVRLLSLFADQAAVAIENAQLYEEAQERTAQLATLNQIGQAVSALQDLDSVLELIYRQVQRIASVDAFYICLYDSEQEQISFPLVYDAGMRYYEPTLPLRPDTWIAQVIRTGQPFMLLRTADEMQVSNTRGIGNMQRRSASILLVPLWHGEHAVGVLSVQSYTLNAYTQQHAEIFTGIGIQAAIAIENAKLFTAAQQELAERKRIQAERERLIAELENKNAELERFTYTVSHDLKAPLITIRGFLGFLEEDARAQHWERFMADLARIMAATDKMRRLLDELLELSRIGRLLNPPESMPFTGIVQEALQLVQGRLEARGVQVEVQADLPQVRGDRMRLIEVVQNLVDNACKFMGEQAAPRITIGSYYIDHESQPILFVRDNGIGIDPRYQEKVFGLFDKLDPRSEGTGIGLAVVKRIVEVHGGRIWVESEGVKTGSTFYFTLPVK